MIGKFIDQIIPEEELPKTLTSYSPVSYTHLDVYKRQAANCKEFANAFFMDYSISGENEAREEVFLTESNKSPGSISKSNNQGNLLASGEVQAPSDKLRSTYSVMSK